jgi:hypothetical protein
MTLAEQGHRLRTEILRLGIGHGRRYKPRLRRRILAWVDRAKQTGISERECSERLGIAYKRFSIWRADGAKRPKQLVEVEVTSDESSVSATFAIASPSGYRIDGLTLDQAVAFMRALA